MIEDSVIVARGANFAYGAEPVLVNVNLTVRHRDFVCVMGPNGGGKTTLLKLLLGLLKPASGTVRVLGQPPGVARRQLGYMPQHARLDPAFPVTVGDVVLMGRLGHGHGLGPRTAADRAAVEDALAEVGMADHARRSFGSLSGGQRQRALIARALACEPQLLLLDEPTANLDPKVQDDLYELLRRLNQRLTVVMVSHDVGFVSLYFNTVVCVNRTVHTHAAGDLTHELVAEVFGRQVRMVHPVPRPHGGHKA